MCMQAQWLFVLFYVGAAMNKCLKTFSLFISYCRLNKLSRYFLVKTHTISTRYRDRQQPYLFFSLVVRFYFDYQDKRLAASLINANQVVILSI